MPICVGFWLGGYTSGYKNTGEILGMIYRFRKDTANPYVMVHKGLLEDIRLTAKAKGIMAYLLGKPDTWSAHERDLIKNFDDGRDSIRAGLKELEGRGYLKRKQIRLKDGRFSVTCYDIYENPCAVVIEIPIDPYEMSVQFAKDERFREIMERVNNELGPDAGMW